MTNNLFDDIIKQKADGHQATIPPDAWDNINNKKNRKPFGWWWFALLLIAGSTAIYVHHTYNDAATVAAQNKQMPISDSSVLPKNNTVDSKEMNGDQQEQTKHDNIAHKDIASTSSLNNVQPADAIASSLKKVNTKHIYHHVDNSNHTTSPTAFVTHHHYLEAKHLPIAYTSIKNKKRDYSLNTKFTAKRKLAARIHYRQTIAALDSADNATLIDPNTNPIPTHTNKIDASAKDISSDQPKKVIVADTTTEIKKPIAFVKTITKKKNDTNDSAANLNIEVSTTGILPIEQQENIVNNERITMGSNSKTDYTADHQETSIQPALAYNIAILKRINNKYKIGIGFQYLKLKEDIQLSGTETTTTYTPIQRLVTDSSGTHLINTFDTTTATGKRNIHAVNSYQFYTIPLLVQCLLSQHGSWSLLLDGGLYFNITDIYHNSIEGKWTAANAGTSNNGMSVDIVAGIRASKYIDKRCSLFAEPVLRYSLSSQQSFIPKKIDQVGLSFGISYKID
jgi:hypothetical protein